jgi:hypothetical protein
VIAQVVVNLVPYNHDGLLIYMNNVNASSPQKNRKEPFTTNSPSKIHQQS